MPTFVPRIPTLPPAPERPSFNTMLIAANGRKGDRYVTKTEFSNYLKTTFPKDTQLRMAMMDIFYRYAKPYTIGSKPQTALDLTQAYAPPVIPKLPPVW